MILGLVTILIIAFGSYLYGIKVGHRAGVRDGVNDVQANLWRML